MLSVCSLRYPACSEHAPYHIVIGGLSDSTIFSQIISRTARFSKTLLNIKYFATFFTIFSQIFLILRRIEWDVIKNVHWFSCKVPVILVRLKWNINFLEIFSKNTRMSDFMKIRPVAAELYADGRTDIETDRRTWWS
jgi:hypothetical protein